MIPTRPEPSTYFLLFPQTLAMESTGAAHMPAVYAALIISIAARMDTAAILNKENASDV